MTVLRGSITANTILLKSYRLHNCESGPKNCQRYSPDRNALIRLYCCRPGYQIVNPIVIIVDRCTGDVLDVVSKDIMNGGQRVSEEVKRE